MERLTEKASKYRDFRTEGYSIAIKKFNDYEDFMKEHKAKGLEQLENILQTMLSFERDKITYQLENQTLKDRWKKLKEFLDKDITNGEYYFKILNKMQELEKESK